MRDQTKESYNFFSIHDSMRTSTPRDNRPGGEVEGSEGNQVITGCGVGEDWVAVSSVGLEWGCGGKAGTCTTMQTKCSHNVARWGMMYERYALANCLALARGLVGEVVEVGAWVWHPCYSTSGMPLARPRSRYYVVEAQAGAGPMFVDLSVLCLAIQKIALGGS